MPSNGITAPEYYYCDYGLSVRTQVLPKPRPHTTRALALDHDPSPT